MGRKLLDDLSPPALSAAMRGGTAGWGQHGSMTEHVRYAEPVDARSRRRCHCGCRKRATHRGMANGVCLTMGCELFVRGWVKDPFAALRASATRGAVER